MKETVDLAESAWALRESDLKQSFKLASQAREEALQSNNRHALAKALKCLGYCYWRFSDYSKSLEASHKAIQIFKELKDKKGEADALNSVGAAYMFRREHDKRLETNLECLKIRKEIGDTRGVAGSQNNIGETYFEMGNLDQAEIWFKKCLNNPNSTEDVLGWATYNLGKLSLKLDKSIEAEEFFNRSLKLTKSAKCHVLTCEVLNVMAEYLLKEGRIAEADNLIEENLSLSEDIAAWEERVKALRLKADLLEKKGETGAALSYYKEYHLLFERIFNEAKESKLNNLQHKLEVDKISEIAEIERSKSEVLQEANDELREREAIIRQKNNEILDSIAYAKNIQLALKSDTSFLKDSGINHFVVDLPKDIVSGDFYWMHETGRYVYVACMDCTGHGVPGAFLTILGKSFLNEVISRLQAPTPAQILDSIRLRFIKELSKNQGLRDGMDMALVRIEKSTNKLLFSGAMRPLWLLRDQKMLAYPGNRQSICVAEKLRVFDEAEIMLQKGDRLYLFSDGFTDQFGGTKSGKTRKIKSTRLKQLLTDSATTKMSDQRQALLDFFMNWKGDLNQIDDVMIVGLEVNP